MLDDIGGRKLPSQGERKVLMNLGAVGTVLIFQRSPETENPGNAIFETKINYWEASQRFRKGVGGRGLATNRCQNTAKIDPQNCVPLLPRVAYEKGHRKRPESLIFQRP